MEEQDKTPEKEVNELEIGHLPEKELKVMIVKMFKEIGRRMDAQSEMLAL